MMTLINDIYAVGTVNKAELSALCMMLNPFAPHITEEIYNIINGKILSEQSWITYDEKFCVDETIEIVVQVNGKIKAKLNIVPDTDKDSVIAMALADEKVKEFTDGKTIIKQIYVPNKLVNIVAK